MSVHVPVRVRITSEIKNKAICISIVDMAIPTPDVYLVLTEYKEDQLPSVAKQVVDIIQKHAGAVCDIDIGPGLQEDVVSAVVAYMSRPRDDTPKGTVQGCSVTIHRHLIAAQDSRGFSHVFLGPVGANGAMSIRAILADGRVQDDERDISIPYIELIETHLSGIAAQGVMNIIVHRSVPMWVQAVITRVFGGDIRMPAPEA